ncbi:MAG TPA: adenylate cyclase [Candidatus Dormibacteraeota bacterium]
MRKLFAAALFAGFAIATTSLPVAAMVTPTTGQPGAPTNTCGPDNPMTPGNAANSPGSPFNAFGQAGVVYAGNPGTASLAHSNSSATVSQYDAACVRLSSH